MRLFDSWEKLLRDQQFGGSIRVAGTNDVDVVCSLDPVGRWGIQLISIVQIASVNAMRSLDISVGRRIDGKWILSVWLRESSLRLLFAELCKRLVLAGLSADVHFAREFVAELEKWQKLLKGDFGGLSAEVARGLLGELLVLESSIHACGTKSALRAWVGPIDAPQDFAFSGCFIEVKSVLQEALAVTVSSLSQLDPLDNVYFAVCRFSSMASRASGGFSTRDVIERLSLMFGASEVEAGQFEAKLRFMGVALTDPMLDELVVLESLRLYAVRDEFPRLRRADVPVGVVAAEYVIALSSLTAFELPFSALSEMLLDA